MTATTVRDDANFRAWNARRTAHQTAAWVEATHALAKRMLNQLPPDPDVEAHRKAVG